ncbi:MAG: 1-acyl-sn-glycerol-3-phosphate acyltransferase, partial [Deltaproteobacteria bacterium]|nr:1-acyl-sn-glycerol-3-phosphate acyltransferase [Deltaproteobacteria bacterium]
SSVDPFILSACTGRILSFLIAREFYHIPLINRLFRWAGYIPVRRDGRDIGSLRRALTALNHGRALCIFPQGGIDRDWSEAKDGTAYLAWRSKAPVIPAGISGTPQGQSVWRPLLMQSCSQTRFGPPFPPPPDPTDRQNREQVAIWTGRLMKTIAGLSKD